MSEKLTVRVNGKGVGDLSFEDGEFVFAYKDTKDFISLTMPARSKTWNSKNLHPIFEMHLPEGYLLSVIKKHFSKFCKTDDFGLLRILSPFIRGRISYESAKGGELKSFSLDELINSNNENLFDELIRRFALNSPISGVQPKVLARIKNKATLNLEEYIVKSWGEEYNELALNEFLCMEVVKSAKIPVPKFYLSKDRKLFIMKRFDIRADGTYLGFEDMCVLQGKNRDDKYEGSYEKIAKSIKIYVSKKHKKEALKKFFKMVVLNFLLKNGDGHLKNFGLIYGSVDDIDLAPAYDVVTTLVYIKKDIPALHLLGSKKWWDEKYLLRFGVESCDLTPKEAKYLYEICLKARDEVVEKYRDLHVEFTSQLFDIWYSN
ncbi:MAG: phosphatidylinositol kinase [Proteobacteria bacterium]|nr:MAG: phosphatidylinositol kinase [Pseudomonadota bacterium]